MIRIVKDWTLPLAMGLGTAVYLLFAFTPGLEQAALFFRPVMATILPWFMFLILFVTFCKMDFRQLFPVAWHLWVGIVQVLFVCAMVAVILMARSSDGMNGSVVLFEAVMMCVICPCATAAAVVTQKLGGSLEQMTTYTFLSNFITVFLVPVCFPLIEPGIHIEFWPAFLKILHEVFAVLIMPMILAFAVKHTMQKLHAWIVSKRDLSYYLWACSLMLVTGTTVKNIVHAEVSFWLLATIAVMGLAVCVVQFAVGRYIGHFFGRTQEAGQALGQKNTVFAIWLSSAYLDPLSSVGPGCYILWQNIINSVEIWAYRRVKANSETI